MKQEKNRLIPLSEASKLSGYTQDYLSSLCRQGKLSGTKMGRNWVVPLGVLEAFMRGDSIVQFDEDGRNLPVGTPELSNINDPQVDDELASLKALVVADTLSKFDARINEFTETVRVEQQNFIQRFSLIPKVVKILKSALTPLVLILAIACVFLFQDNFFGTENAFTRFSFYNENVLDQKGVVIEPSDVFTGGEVLGSHDVAGSGKHTTKGKVLAQTKSVTAQPVSEEYLHRVVGDTLQMFISNGWLHGDSAAPASPALIVQSANPINNVPTQQLVYAPITYFPPSGISSGGSLFSATDLSSTNFITESAKVNKTATIETLRVTGSATLESDISVSGNVTASSGTTTLGQLLSTRVPTLAHAFTTWPSGTSNASDATIYLNPATAAADTNLIAAAVGGSVKFLVDAEGDIYGSNLILTGSTSTGATVIAGNLTVQDNAFLGDAISDTTRIAGKMSINLATPTALQGDLDIRQITNGDTILYAKRNTDTSPTGNFITYQNAAGSNLFTVDTTGAVVSANSLTVPIIYGGSGVSSTLTLAGTSNGSPSSAYIILNGSGQGNVGIGTTSPGGQLQINTASASTKGVIIKASASQNVNLLDIQDSTGTTIAGINKDGSVLILTSPGEGIVVGDSNSNVTGGSNSLAVGLSSRATGSQATAIGSYNVLSSGTASVAIGASTSATANYGIAVGYGATDAYGSVAIGRSATTTAANQLVIGSSAAAISDVYFGQGVIYTSPAAYTINGTGGSGTNIAGGNLQFAAGKATGSATGGDILFQTSDTGSSGASLQSLTTKMILKSTGFVGIGTSSPDARLELAGNQTAPAWGLNGMQLQGSAATYTDSSTASSGTATNAVFNSFAQPTLAATNTSVTTTNAATVYIAGAPTAGANQTISNAYALWVDSGNARLDGDINVQGNLYNTAGTVSITDTTSIGNDTLFVQYNGFNGYVGIGDTDPDYTLEISDGSSASGTSTLAMSEASVAHGLTALAQTDIYSLMQTISTTAGGLKLEAFSDTDAQALAVYGYIGSTDPTDTIPAIKLVGAKKNTTNVQDLASAETVFQVANNDDSAAFTILGNSNVGIGATAPVSRLEVSGGDITLESGNVGREIKFAGGRARVCLYCEGAGTHFNIITSSGRDIRFYTDAPTSGDPAGTERMTIASGGKVGIGTTSPTQAKFVVAQTDAANDEAVYIDTEESTTTQDVFVIESDTTNGSGADTEKFKITADGSTYNDPGTFTTPADVAEMYYTTGEVEPGDIVVATSVGTTPDGTSFGVRQFNPTTDVEPLGIVSTKPGQTLGFNWKRPDIVALQKPVALAGRVPVKISLENGPINRGDFVTPSLTKPGYAMKALGEGMVLGQALESYISETTSSRIEVFVNVHYWIPRVAYLLQEAHDQNSLDSFLVDVSNINMINARVFDDIAVRGSVYIAQDLHVAGVIYAADIQGDSITAKQKVCIGQTCVTEDQLKAILQLTTTGTTASVSGDTSSSKASSADTAPSTIPNVTPSASADTTTPDKILEQNPDSL